MKGWVDPIAGMRGWVDPTAGMNERLGGPHSRYECCEEQTNPCLCWESKFVTSAMQQSANCMWAEQ